MNRDDIGEIIVILLVGAGLAIGGLYAFTGGLPGVGDKDTQIAIDENGEKATCPNVGLVKKRELYNVYVTGGLNLDREEFKSPNILVTQEDIDKEDLAIVSINSRIEGDLFTTVDNPQSDVGYEGRIYFYDNIGNDIRYKMKFTDVPSNWNCENYQNSDTYRPNGARYQLNLTWWDKDQQEVVSSRTKMVYVKYQGGS